MVLCDNFSSICNDYISKLPDKWDLCWIGTCCDIHANVQEGVNIYKQKGSRCTHAYLISLECAKKIQEELKYADLCADYYYNFLIDKYQLNNYWTEPAIALQRSGVESTVQNSDLF